MRIQARAGGIYVDDAGSGHSPVLFLHSLGGSTAQWWPQLVHVRARGCAVAMDLRGHGNSDPPHDRNYSLEAAAEDVIAVMDARGLDQVILVGHSMGGGVATVVAGQHPERVSGLLLVDPVGDQRLAPPEQIEPFLQLLDSQAYGTAIAEHFGSIAGNDPNVRRRVLDDLACTPRATVVGMLRALARTDLISMLRNYVGPKHALITPLNDFPFSLHRLDRGLSITCIEGTGHWPQLERPNELNRLLDDFIARVSPVLR